MGEPRDVRLFRNGRNQAIRIPVEWELPGDTATIHREGDKIVIEPKQKRRSLLDILATLEPLDEEFPDIDEGLLPLDDIDL